MHTVLKQSLGLQAQDFWTCGPNTTKHRFNFCASDTNYQKTRTTSQCQVCPYRTWITDEALPGGTLHNRLPRRPIIYCGAYIEKRPCARVFSILPPQRSLQYFGFGHRVLPKRSRLSFLKCCDIKGFFFFFCGEVKVVTKTMTSNVYCSMSSCGSWYWIHASLLTIKREKYYFNTMSRTEKCIQIQKHATSKVREKLHSHLSLSKSDIITLQSLILAPILYIYERLTFLIMTLFHCYG